MGSSSLLACKGEQVRIILVDPNAGYLEQIRRVISRVPEFIIAGEAVTGLDGTSLIADLKPELALVSHWLPDMTVKTLISRFKSFNPAIRVAIVSFLSDQTGYRFATECGADGFIPKTRLKCELLKLLFHYHDITQNQAECCPPWIVRNERAR